MIRNRFKKLTKNFYILAFTVPIVSGLVIAVREAGWLQPLELALLDYNFQSRPLEPIDERIVIVGATERDIENLGGWSTSDWVIARLLNKIKFQQPRAIGLDLYRNKALKPGSEELIKVFYTTPNLIGVQKLVSDKFSPQIPPSESLQKLDQVSSNDIVIDPDGVARRGVLFPLPGKNIQNLGLALSLIYLNKQGINPVAGEDGFLKLGTTSFVPFNSNDGSYVRADAGGYQTILNFRGQTQSFVRVSFTDVLHNRISPNLMRDRIVLIGSVAPSINDAFLTPYSRSKENTPIRMPGVEIEANLTSQILSAVLDNRPLIKGWSESTENVWIAGWSLVVVSLSLSWVQEQEKIFSAKFLLRCLTIFSLAITSLFIINYLIFMVGWWIPLLPASMAIVGSATTTIGCVYILKLRELSSEIKVSNYHLSTVNQLLELVVKEKKNTSSDRSDKA